jgi:hypothetical protein
MADEYRPSTYCPILNALVKFLAMIRVGSDHLDHPLNGLVHSEIGRTLKRDFGMNTSDEFVDRASKLRDLISHVTFHKLDPTYSSACQCDSIVRWFFTKDIWSKIPNTIRFAIKCSHDDRCELLATQISRTSLRLFLFINKLPIQSRSNDSHSRHLHP